MSKEYTTIRILKRDAERLKELSHPGEDHAQVVHDLLGDEDPYRWLSEYKERQRQEAEERARKAHQDHIKAELAKYGPKADEARKKLGLDLKPGETKPAWNSKRKRG